jgi:hypothetical protein
MEKIRIRDKHPGSATLMTGTSQFFDHLVAVQVAVSLLLMVAGCSGQQYVLTPPYFNIAEKRYDPVNSYISGFCILYCRL